MERPLHGLIDDQHVEIKNVIGRQRCLKPTLAQLAETGKQITPKSRERLRKKIGDEQSEPFVTPIEAMAVPQSTPAVAPPARFAAD
jgi:hypothetical protein